MGGGGKKKKIYSSFFKLLILKFLDQFTTRNGSGHISAFHTTLLNPRTHTKITEKAET